MRKKSKLAVMFLALFMSAGALVGCGPKGGDTPPQPVGTEWFINVYKPDDVLISGLKEEGGYYKGDLVSFTLSLAPSAVGNKEISYVTWNENPIIKDDEGLYKFQMPDEDVDITVTTRAINKYELTYSPTAKNGVPLQFELTFGGQIRVDWSLTTNATHYEMDASKHIISFLQEGDVSVSAVEDGNVVATVSFNVGPSEKGETEGNPYSAQEAYEIAKALESGATTDDAYYIRGVVTSIDDVYTTQYANFSAWLDGVFLVYRAQVQTSELGANCILGALVTVYAKITNYNNTKMETASAVVKKADISNPYLIVFGEGEDRRSCQVGQDLKIDVTVHPLGSVATLSYDSSDETVATIKQMSDSAVTIHGEKVGDTIITATSSDGKLSASIAVHVQNESVHGETRDDPLTPEEACELAGKLEKSTKDEKHPSDLTYFVRGIITTVGEYNDYYKNLTFWLGDFECYRMAAATEDFNILDCVKGSDVIVRCQLLLFGTTKETYDGATVVAVDNSKAAFVEIDETDFELKVGTSKQLTGIVHPVSCKAETSWESSDPTAVSVEDGLVTAGCEVTQEPVTITFRCGELTATCEVNVVDHEAIDKWDTTDFPDIKSFTEVPWESSESTEKYYFIGKIEEIVPKSSNKPAYTYINDRTGENRVQIFGIYNEDGTVAWDDMPDERRAHKGDVVVVYGSTLNYNNATKEIKNGRIMQINGVPASGPLPTKITFANSEISLAQGRTSQLVPIVEPIDASLKNAVWTSSDQSKVTVSQEGLVTAIAETEEPVEITCKVRNVTGVCKVNVTEYIPMKYFTKVTDEANIGEGTYIIATPNATELDKLNVFNGLNAASNYDALELDDETGKISEDTAKVTLKVEKMDDNGNYSVMICGENCPNNGKYIGVDTTIRGGNDLIISDTAIACQIEMLNGVAVLMCSSWTFKISGTGRYYFYKAGTYTVASLYKLG